MKSKSIWRRATARILYFEVIVTKPKVSLKINFYLFLEIHTSRIYYLLIFFKDAEAYKGTYFCEVSTETPMLTDYAEATINVAIIPKENPKLEGLAPNYQVGEMLEATCTSAPSLPASELTFYLNDKKVFFNYIYIVA